MWIQSALTKGQRVQTYTSSFKVITEGLRGMTTNVKFCPRVWLLDAFGIEIVITLFLIL